MQKKVNSFFFLIVEGAVLYTQQSYGIYSIVVVIITLIAYSLTRLEHEAQLCRFLSRNYTSRCRHTEVKNIVMESQLPWAFEVPTVAFAGWLRLPLRYRE